jgi:hypothetical protein
MYSVYRSAVVRVCIIIVCLLMLDVNKVWAAGNAAVKVINFSGGGTITATVKNISDNQPAAGGLITWSNTQAGVTNWKLADQYIEIIYSDLPQNWGMQIYTDNKNTSANPRYTGPINPAGLIKTTDTTVAIPAAWRITDTLLTGDGLANPIERTDSIGFDDYLWHFFKDKSAVDDPITPINERFTNGEDYVTFWNPSGIAWNEGGRSGNPKKAYLYLAAKFSITSANVEYKTSMLTIEGFHGISVLPIYLYKDAPKTEYPDEPGATFDNHFAPSGWLNYKESKDNIVIDTKCKDVTPKAGTHCFKLLWNGKKGADGSKWGGVMWLEPKDIWDYSGGNHPTHNGYDLRGATQLSFWARTDSANSGNLQINTYFGNTWDSSGQTPPLWRTPKLTTAWQYYIIPVLTRDMSDVTGGLAVVFDDAYDPNPDGCTIYLDEIKFE